jgi:hypothetical protein
MILLVLNKKSVPQGKVSVLKIEPEKIRKKQINSARTATTLLVSDSRIRGSSTSGSQTCSSGNICFFLIFMAKI